MALVVGFGLSNAERLLKTSTLPLIQRWVRWFVVDKMSKTAKLGPLAVFDEVRAQPLHQPEEVGDWMDRADSERKSDWRGES